MKFQWLKDYQELEEQILYLKWNLNKSKLELDRWINGDLANVKLDKHSRASRLEENIQRIEGEIGLLQDQINEAKLIVGSFKGLDNQIMYEKYINGLSLEQVADATGYSESYVKKRHAELKKSIDFLDEYIIKKANMRMNISLQDHREKGSQKVHSNQAFKY